MGPATKAMAPNPPQRIRELFEQVSSGLVMEVEQVRGTFVRKDERGERNYVSPIPLPFHYGFCPDQMAPDGSGLDLLLLDGVPCAVGDHIGVQVVAVADFQDGLDWDPKLIVRRQGSTRGLRRPEWALLSIGLRILAGLKASRIFAGQRRSPAQCLGLYSAPWALSD